MLPHMSYNHYSTQIYNFFQHHLQNKFYRFNLSIQRLGKEVIIHQLQSVNPIQILFLPVQLHLRHTLLLYCPGVMVHPSNLVDTKTISQVKIHCKA
mgnify:FL=1